MPFSAADVERFAYCPLSWALSERGETMDAVLKAGEAEHEAFGKRIGAWRRVLDEHNAALKIALYLALTAASAATLALEVMFLDFDGVAPWLLMSMSLFWLFTALVFLARALWKQDEAHAHVASAGLVHGELAYSDLDRPGETMRSERYDLSGRPDYVVRRGDEYLPVEVKTGRTPDAPHDSHLMQLGVYCILVEEAYGTRPSRGYLQYPERTFEVAFTDDFRDKVLEATLRMRLAKMTGTIHRNHERVGKCRGCSRRAACPERLA